MRGGSRGTQNRTGVSFNPGYDPFLPVQVSFATCVVVQISLNQPEHLSEDARISWVTGDFLMPRSPCNAICNSQTSLSVMQQLL